MSHVKKHLTAGLAFFALSGPAFALTFPGLGEIDTTKTCAGKFNGQFNGLWPYPGKEMPLKRRLRYALTVRPTGKGTPSMM
jgi:hypothetical protein